MITDSIENIRLYTMIPDFVDDFIKNLTSDTPCGRYEINDSAYANIETYSTKSVLSAKYEQHKKYIDIQLLLTGTEKIYYKPCQNTAGPLPFDDDKDIRFFNEPINSESDDCVNLNCKNFMLIYPHEAHAPQVQSENAPAIVKKVVIKLLA